MTKKFNNIEEEQCWTPILWNKRIYDLSHLHSSEVIYKQSKAGYNDAIYKFIITFSFHCFAKEDKNTTPDTPNVHTRKDHRPFNIERYHLSKQLPQIISSLGKNHIPCFNAGYDRYLSIKLKTESGDEFNYHVIFRTFREKKKLRLHVESAYPEKLTKTGKQKKIGFFVIARNTLLGKK